MPIRKNRNDISNKDGSGSSLSREVVDRLPYDKKKGKLIYYRPQVGSGVCLKGGLGESINKRVSETMLLNGKHVANPAEFRQTEFDNPNVNALLAFESRPMADNFYHARRLVLTFNYPHRRDHDRIGEYRLAYYQSLEDCNCCYYCKKPIKTIRARITGKDAIEARNDPFFAESIQMDKLDKKKDGVGKLIRSVRGEQLRGVRYQSYSKENNTTYGDIKSHFRYIVTERNEKGLATKYAFVFFDGTERRIQQRKRANSVVRYFVEVMPDGSEREIIPQASYRIKGKGCKCGKRGGK